jgi:hypothetical protein
LLIKKGLGEYILFCIENEDLDKVITSKSTNRPIYRMDGQESDLEPSYSTKWYFEELPGFMDSTPIFKHVPQDQCCDLNIGREGKPRNIQINKHLSHQEI